MGSTDGGTAADVSAAALFAAAVFGRLSRMTRPVIDSISLRESAGTAAPKREFVWVIGLVPSVRTYFRINDTQPCAGAARSEARAALSPSGQRRACRSDARMAGASETNHKRCVV